MKNETNMMTKIMTKTWTKFHQKIVPKLGGLVMQLTRANCRGHAMRKDNEEGRACLNVRREEGKGIVDGHEDVRDGIVKELHRDADLLEEHYDEEHAARQGVARVDDRRLVVVVVVVEACMSKSDTHSKARAHDKIYVDDDLHRKDGDVRIRVRATRDALTIVPIGVGTAVAADLALIVWTARHRSASRTTFRGGGKARDDTRLQKGHFAVRKASSKTK